MRVKFSLNEKISYILNNIPEKIYDATRYRIKNPNLLLMVFLHEDISKICNEPTNFQIDNLEKMKMIKEDFLTLAFIGDCALETGILPSIWEDKNAPRHIPLKGTLDERKKNFVKNENLAQIWDFLDFYDNNVLIRRKNESLKLRASRMEAVFGLIYLECGLEAVELAIKNLKILL